MKAIRNSLTVFAFTAAAVAASAHAAQPNGRDSVYLAGTAQVGTPTTVQVIDQVPGRAGGLATGTKLKAGRSGSDVADLTNRLGRA